MGLTGLPGTAVFIDQLVERAIAADQVMRADLACRVGERLERSLVVVG